MLGKFIAYCLLSASIANLLTFPVAYLFYIDLAQFRTLYNIVREEPGLMVIKEWNSIGQGMGMQVALALTFVAASFTASFYFGIIFSAVYFVQSGTWIVGLIVAFVADFILLEPLFELLVAGMYTLRTSGVKRQLFAELINRYRRIRTLT